MIKITKEYELENLTGEFTHEWVLPDCVTLISSVVVENIISATFDFCDNDCLLNFNQIGLKVTDSEGCLTNIDSVFDAVCTDFNFSQNGISILEDCGDCSLEYKAPTNETGVTYEWVVDSNIFTTTTDRDRVTLSYTDTPLIVTDNTTLQVIATNKYGCQVTDTLSIPLCQIEDLKYDFNITCLPNRFGGTDYATPNIALGMPCDKELDYSTAELLTIDGEATTEQRVKIGINYFRVVIPTIEETTTSMVLGMRIKDCTGLPYYFSLCLNVVHCTVTPNIIPFNFNFGCEECTDTDSFRPVNSSRESECSSNISINLEDLITGNIDWTTFMFIPSTGQTLIDDTTLLTPHGEANLDINRNVLFTYNGGLQTLEIITYSIEVNGILTTGRLEFQGTRCGSTPVAVDDSICMLSDATTGYIDITANDSGAFTQMIITEYPNVQTLVNGNRVKFIGGGYVGTTILRYKLKNEAGLESNIARVVIEVSDANIVTTDLSTCLNSIVDLNSLVADTGNLPWSFIGYTTEVTDIPGQLDSPEFTIGDIIGNPNITFTNAGIYTFQYGESDSCTAYTTVNVEVIAAEQIVDLSVEVCAGEEIHNLNELANVSEGTWTDLNLIPIPNFDGVNIPADTMAGFYTFRYNEVNEGIYNTTACSNTFVLTLEIQNQPDTVAPQCLTYCSYGPDPVLDPSCQANPIVITNPPTTGCEYDLYQEMGLPPGSTIQLLAAPFTPIYLYINGMNLLLTAGSFLPEGVALWANGDAPLGTYLFRAFYGDACPNEVDFEVNIYQAACALTDTTIEKCNTDDTFNIFTEASGQTNCLDNNFTELVLISENIVGEGTSIYNLTTGDFTPSVPGQWVFGFTATVTGTDGTCSACNTDATITIIVNPLPGSGVPQPGAVCNDGACVVDVYPDMFTPNASILGVFCYDGFASTPTGVPGVGGWGGIEPTLNPGDISGPAYTFEGALPGFYFFSNKVTDVNGCTFTSQTIVQVTSAGAAGTADPAIDICELTPVCYTLRDLLTTEDAGGVWSSGGNYTNAFISCDPGFFVLGDAATFNTDGMPVGTYTFTYTVTTPNNLYPIFDGCVSCTGSTATITINITAGVSAGDGSSQMVCA